MDKSTNFFGGTPLLLSFYLEVGATPSCECNSQFSFMTKNREISEKIYFRVS